MAVILAKAEALGGICHINHPGRYTGGSNGNDEASIAASNNPTNVKKYVDLLMTYPSCVGIEIINKIDNESKSERILWDNILKQTMPEGRFVWGFSNDDSHHKDSTGYAWNVMLMPELNQVCTRAAMEKGAFYAVSRVSRLDGINRYNPSTGVQIPGAGDTSTLYLLEQPTPSISNIKVEGNTITISGTNFNRIEWIADGTIIATGASINLNDHADKINSYVRAQLKSPTGIAFTQPFGVNQIAAHEVTFKVIGSNGELIARVDDVEIQSGAMVQQGKSVTFTANPDSGYSVLRWKLNGSTILGHMANTYSLTNLTSDAIVTVEFINCETGCNAGYGIFGALAIFGLVLGFRKW
jgi:hypothetical protein